MEKEKVIIDEKEYELACSLDVLEELQDKFGSLTEFENKIMGIIPKRDKDGKYVRNEDGKIAFTTTEPSIKAIRYSLPLMIKAADSNVNVKELEKAISEMKFNVFDVAKPIANIFEQCFVRKNL